MPDEHLHGTHEIGRQFDAAVYDESYFKGGDKSHYDDYDNCQGIVEKQFEIINGIMYERVLNRTHLDVACAYGFSVNKMRNHGWISNGTDISEFAINKAVEKYGAEGFKVADAMSDDDWLAFPQYGLITAVEFFEHIPSDEADKVIEQFAAHGEWGFFLVNGRTYPGEPEDKIDSDAGHLNFHNMSWWITQFAKYGEIDWDAMFEFNKEAEKVEGVHWVNRCVVVRFK